MTRLSVNITKVATLRNSRGGSLPDLLQVARDCEAFGAEGITVHPRPDQRHIKYNDVPLLKALVQTEFNIEGNPFHNLMDFVRELRPHQCTFVPDSEGQFTSDHGWSFPADAQRLKPLIDEAHALGVRVSLFMDPDPGVMAAVKAAGADRVELYTESYASAYGTADKNAVLSQFAAAAKAALEEGLGVNAGHDLNQENLTDFLRAVPGVQEVSIGHALISDALELGYEATVKAYLRSIDQAFGAAPSA